MRTFILLFILLLQTFVYANKLKIAVGSSIPPYVIKEHDSGFEIEMIRQVLASKGYEVSSFVYASNVRMVKLLEKYQVDASINIPLHLPHIFYSDVIVNFDNVAITLKKRDITIQTVKDLHYKRVLAFQNAHKLMGKTFEEYAFQNPLYDETIHQTSQVKNLVQKRVDVVITDKHIFQYYYNHLYDEFDANIAFNYFKIFDKSPRYMGFTNKKIRDDFNKALKQYKQSPQYQELLRKYNLMDE